MGQRSPLTETREAHLLQEDPVQPKLKKKKKDIWAVTWASKDVSDANVNKN